MGDFSIWEKKKKKRTINSDEKSGWLQPKASGQQLYVQVGADSERCSPGIHLGTSMSYKWIYVVIFSASLLSVSRIKCAEKHEC